MGIRVTQAVLAWSCTPAEMGFKVTYSRAFMAGGLGLNGCKHRNFDVSLRGGDELMYNVHYTSDLRFSSYL